MESKDSMEDIDLEEGKIRINGKWLTEDEIRYAIKMKISSDDYNVADLAVALRKLIDEMNRSQVLKVRVPKELVEELKEMSEEKEESVEALLRRILMDYIHSPKEIEDETEEEEDEGEDEDFNDIEIGSRSKATEEVEPEITVEAEPIEEAGEEVTEGGDILVPDEEGEEVVDIPEEEIEIGEGEPEEDTGNFEENHVLDVEEELDIDDDLNQESEETGEIEEEIELGEELVGEAVPDKEPQHEDKKDTTEEEPAKEENKMKKPILRRKKILRRRP